MISMTGYAYCSANKCDENGANAFSLTLEIKGCNSRYLDISINLPPFLSMLENKIREKITETCNRGKIEVYVRTHEQNVPVNVSVNKSAAKAYYDAFLNLANELKIQEAPRLYNILQMDGVLSIEKDRNEEKYWNTIEPLLIEALKIFINEKQREGSYTEEDILKNLKIIESSVDTVTKFAPVIEKSIKENIKSRFAELLGNQVDENRVYAETASLLLKYTISEEISRLNSHLNEFLIETKNNPHPGKKLDFLCQEINREINTIGSKSAIVEVSREVVKMKEALENIREQLRNVE